MSSSSLPAAGRPLRPFERTQPSTPAALQKERFEREHETPRRGARASGVACGLLASVLFVLGFGRAFWSFILYAPQYPGGLRLNVFLTGVTGDVREIDTLNHYIGMAPLTLAAPLERALAGYALTLIVAAMLIGLALGGPRIAIALSLPAITFPVAFVADSQYWLYRFGHDLDPRAPLEMPAFTPQLFGNGTIGQFMTFARPESGFALAVAGSALALLGLGLRLRAAARSEVDG